MNRSFIFSILGCAAALAGLAATGLYLKNRAKKSDSSRLRVKKLPSLVPPADFSQNSTVVQEEKEENENPSKTSIRAARITKSVVCKKTQRYFKVIARCGHVGNKFYILIEFHCRAENAKEAAKKIRNSPRVKHHHKFAISSVQEISEVEFLEGCRKMRENPFFKCHNPQEQRNAMGAFIFENRVPEEPVVCFKKRHTLRSRFNDDDDYELLKNFCGDLTSEEIA